MAMDPSAAGQTLLVATDGSVADGTALDGLVANAEADAAIVVGVGESALAAVEEAGFGTVSTVATVAVGATGDASTVTDALSDRPGPTDAIADRADLGAVGQAINRQVSDLDGDARPVIIVNSLSELLRANTAEDVFYFMHLLEGLIEARDGRGLYLYDRGEHDTHELATLAELADGVVAAPGVDADDIDLSLPEPALGDRAVNRLVAYTPALWLLAVLTFGMTDIVTTYIGLSYGLAYEASPLAAMIFDDHRFGYIYIAKAAVFVLFYLVWRFVPRPYNVSVPLGLSIIGIVITAWNSYVILVGLLS